MKRRGYFFLEVLACLAVMTVIFGSLGAAVLASRRNLTQAAVREQQSETWSQFAQALRDDLREARALKWSAKGGNTLLEIVRADGDFVAYQTWTQNISRYVTRGKKSLQPRDFKLDANFSTLSIGDSQTKEIWKFPVHSFESGGKFDVGDRASFILVETQLKLAQMPARTMLIGAATRVESLPGGAK